MWPTNVGSLFAADPGRKVVDHDLCRVDQPASWRQGPPPSLLDKLLTCVRRTIKPSEFEIVTRRVSTATRNDASRIFSYCSPVELVALYRLARSRPRGTIALEIGSHLGASASYIATAMSDSRQPRLAPAGTLVRAPPLPPLH